MHQCVNSQQLVDFAWSFMTFPRKKSGQNRLRHDGLVHWSVSLLAFSWFKLKTILLTIGHSGLAHWADKLIHVISRGLRCLAPGLHLDQCNPGGGSFTLNSWMPLIRLNILCFCSGCSLRCWTLNWLTWNWWSWITLCFWSGWPWNNWTLLINWVSLPLYWSSLIFLIIMIIKILIFALKCTWTSTQTWAQFTYTPLPFISWCVWWVLVRWNS